MKLFSKRNKNRFDKDHEGYSFRSSRNELISNELRNRLAAEISFLTSVNDFLEFFILFENQKKESIFLDKDKVDGFSLKELGYKMTAYFEFEEFAINKFEYSRQIPTRGEDGKIDRVDRVIVYFDDFKLFDLIEFIVLFSKKEKRMEVIDRFNNILSDEDADYEIINGMVTKKSGEDIYTMESLISNTNLKSKIEDYSYYDDKKDYINSAKVSAEIINIIFSNENKDKKKNEIENLLKKTASIFSTGNKNKEELFKYLNEELLAIKKLNNNIYNVRHTENSTIQLNNDTKEIFYKFVSEKNIAFVRMILLALKDEFIYSEDWEVIKNNYISKYRIDKNQRLVIEKPEFDISNIPF